jgi:penicillin-binding protein 1B
MKSKNSCPLTLYIKEKKSMLKKIIIASLSLLFLVLTSLVIYGLRLSDQIGERFSARRWSIPSKVFSDTTLLYPGQRINPDLFRQKLLALGYRKVRHHPKEKGEMMSCAPCTAMVGSRRKRCRQI